MTYVVKFLHLEERTKDEFEYAHLMDALKVAKETNLASMASRIHSAALSDKQFDELLMTLLTSGFVYTGRRTEQYPDGNMMVYLLKRDDNLKDTPVYPVMPIPFQVNRSGIVDKVSE